MANTVNLTDTELRVQLKTLGVNIGPITVTTRSVYEKKLQKLLLEEPGIAQKSHTNVTSCSTNGQHSKPPSTQRIKQNRYLPRRKTFGFSSDESDNNAERKKQTKISSSHKRRMSSRVSSRSKTPEEKVEQTSESLIRKRKSVPSPVRFAGGYSDDSGDTDGGNDVSFIQITNADTNTSPSLLRSRPWSAITSRRSLAGDSPSPLHSTPIHPESTSSKTAIMDNSSSPLVTYANSPKNMNCYPHAPKSTRNGGDTFRRRALNQALKKKTLDESNVSTTLKESSNLYKFKFAFLAKLMSWFFPKKEKPFEQTTFTHAKNTSSRLWLLHCSVLLPIFTVVFFVTIGLLYLTMHSDDISNNGPVLLSSSEQIKGDRNTTMVIVNNIYTLLATVAGDVICNISNGDKRVPISLLKSQVKVTETRFIKALNLIRKHQEWEIILYKDQHGLELDPTDNLTAVLYLEAKRPILPTFCRFTRALGLVLYRVAVLLTAGLVLWLVFLLRRYQLKKKEEQREKMFVMVEKILEVLKKHYVTSCIEDNVEPFIPILHVRDMIISPQERRSRAKEWEDAVKFISASESRIRVETQRISGGDYRVWRWIQVAMPSNKQQAPNRIWQGEAFETKRSINTPNISPTPCLKIRNMFDLEVEKDANWELQVQDSILEKCSDNNEILSIVVEKNSKEGLVYVKCASRAAAGKVFQSLHGSWFDGSLVTVKFIKLNRFHTRYPRTVNDNTPLKRSSTEPVSTILPPDERTNGL